MSTTKAAWPDAGEKSRKRSSCGADAGEVGRELVAPDERALLGPLAGIADEPCPTPGDGDRPVTGELEPAQVAQLQEIAHLQTVDRRVETDVDALATGVESREQGLVAHLQDKSAPREIFPTGRHGFSLPQAPGGQPTGRRRPGARLPAIRVG